MATVTPDSTVICSGADDVSPTLSVTVTEKLETPAVVGVPVIWPAALRFKPAGRAVPPASDHVNGVLAPDAASVAL